MTGPRPDFLVGADKWRLLARSKVLVNLHRGDEGRARVGPGPGGGPQRLRRGHRAVGGPRPAATRRAPRSWPSRDIGSAGGRRLVARRAPPRPSSRRRRTTCAGASSDMAAPAAGGCSTSAGSSTRRRARQPREPVDRGRIMRLAGRRAADGGLAARGRRRPSGSRRSEPAPLDRTRQHAGVRAATAGRAARAPRCRATARPGHRRLRRRATRPGLAVHVRRGGGRRRHRGAARNALLAATDEPYVAVLDAGDELIGDALRADGGPAPRRPRPRRGALPRDVRRHPGQRPGPRGAAAAPARLPHPRVRRSPDDARGAGRLHRGPRHSPTSSTTTSGSPSRPAVAGPRCSAGSAWRCGPPVSPRLRQVLLLAAAVGGVPRPSARSGCGGSVAAQPVDIDEAGYLLDRDQRLPRPRPTEVWAAAWDAVMAPTVQAPLMTALTAPVFLVTGTGVLPGAAGPAAVRRRDAAGGLRPGPGGRRPPGRLADPRAHRRSAGRDRASPAPTSSPIASRRDHRADAVGDRAVPQLRPARLVCRRRCVPSAWWPCRGRSRSPSCRRWSSWGSSRWRPGRRGVGVLVNLLLAAAVAAGRGRRPGT